MDRINFVQGMYPEAAHFNSTQDEIEKLQNRVVIAFKGDGIVSGFTIRLDALEVTVSPGWGFDKEGQVIQTDTSIKHDLSSIQLPASGSYKWVSLVARFTRKASGDVYDDNNDRHDLFLHESMILTVIESEAGSKETIAKPDIDSGLLLADILVDASGSCEVNEIRREKSPSFESIKEMTGSHEKLTGADSVHGSTVEAVPDMLVKRSENGTVKSGTPVEPDDALRLTEKYAALDYTYVVDSNKKLEDWAKNVSGNDYTSILIKKGEWTLNIPADGSFIGIDFIKSNTIKVSGEIGSSIHIKNIAYNGQYFGLYNNVPYDGYQYIKNIKVSCDSGNVGDGTAFSNFNKITNCIGNGISNASGAGIGYGYGFSNCNNLTNCSGTGIGFRTGCGFFNCNNFTLCVGTGTGTGPVVGTGYGYGFSNCNNFTLCNGNGNGTNAGSLSGIITGCGFFKCNDFTLSNGTGTGTGSGKGYGFSECRCFVLCKPSTIAPKTGVYNECYMHSTGTSDPVADTAAGGYNRTVA